MVMGGAVGYGKGTVIVGRWKQEGVTQQDRCFYVQKYNV